MTSQYEELTRIKEVECPHDCECCPYGLNQMECEDLYEDWIEGEACN